MIKDAKKLSLAAIPALLALPGLSAAQMTVEKPWMIKVGGSRWMSSDIRDLTNETAFSFGLGYQMPSHGLLSREFGRSFIEADFLMSDSDGSRLNSFGVWYVERAPFSPPTMGNGGGMFYGGLGVGLAFNSARVEGTGTTGGGGSSGGGSQARPLSLERGVNDESYRSTRVGFLALLGYEFQQNFFVEAQFRWSGAIEGTRTDSLGLMVGFRF